MRPWSLIWVLFVSGCLLRVPVPHPPAVMISVKAVVHADVHVAPPVAVAITGAPVVEFFGIPLDDAKNVVFVLDCSGSMSDAAQGVLATVAAPAPAAAPPAGAVPPPPAGPPPLASKIDVAHRELIDALGRLPAGTQLNVVFFNSDVSAFAPTLFPLDEPSRGGLITFVGAQVATGSTALAPAMRTAFLMNPSRVVLLSDGLGNVGGGSREVLRDAREAMLGGVRIDTVGLGRDQDVALLRTLASESGGLYQSF